VFRDVWTKTLWDHRRSLLGWAIGLIGVSLVYGAFYPYMAEPGYADLLDTLPEGLVQAMGWEDFTSAEGYMGAAVFGVLGQVLTVIMAVGLGARMIAGDEETGGLELLIAHPVSRRRAVAQRALSLLLSMVLAGLAVFLAVFTLSNPIDLGIPVGNLAASSAQMALLGLVFGSLAMAVGGIRGRRGLVIGVTAAVAVLAYLADTVAPLVDAIAWIENLSPFDWYDPTAILREGLMVGDALLSLGASAFLIVVAVVAFDRRDIGV
jgi:ABC-2 type transport system permease protein